MNRFRSRLVGWKANHLSFRGRLTLIKSVLGFIGNYWMSIYLVSLTIINNLERLRASFLWGADLDDCRMHWIREDMVLASRDVGGLGVGSLFAFNRALLLRWKWRFFHNQILLWFGVVNTLYGLGDLSTPLILRRAWVGS